MPELAATIGEGGRRAWLKRVQPDSTSFGGKTAPRLRSSSLRGARALVLDPLAAIRIQRAANRLGNAAGDGAAALRLTPKRVAAPTAVPTRR